MALPGIECIVSTQTVPPSDSLFMSERIVKLKDDVIRKIAAGEVSPG